MVQNLPAPRAPAPPRPRALPVSRLSVPALMAALSPSPRSLPPAIAASPPQLSTDPRPRLRPLLRCKETPHPSTGVGPSSPARPSLQPVYPLLIPPSTPSPARPGPTIPARQPTTPPRLSPAPAALVLARLGQRTRGERVVVVVGGARARAPAPRGSP